MFEHLLAYAKRPTFLVAAGIAIGALFVPTFQDGGAQALTTYTRAVSCQGLAWQPLNYDTHASTSGMLRTSLNFGFYICNPDLPHKAVVTRVRFTLEDRASGQVNNCALVRVPLATATATTYDVMASVGPTTDDGAQRLSDTTISFATIDNMNYGYFLQCYIASFVPADQGIYGADITYKITAANG